MRIGPILLWPQRWVANTHPPRQGKPSTFAKAEYCQLPANICQQSNGQCQTSRNTAVFKLLEQRSPIRVASVG